MHLNSKVPTEAEGRRGVNRKWFLGDITFTWNKSLSISLKNEKDDHPEPKTATFKLVETDVEKRLIIVNVFIYHKNEF